MFNYKLTLEYNGANFHGSQIQNTRRTIERELEEALSIYFQEDIRSCFAGRTDAGVHALGQVANFLVSKPLQEEAEKFLFSINGIIAPDIVVTNIEAVSLDFNARFSAKSRTYLYKIFNRKARPVLRLDSLHWIRTPLNLGAMQAKAQQFLGTHDFQAYSSKNSRLPNYLCTVYESEIIQENAYCFKYKIRANRFLRHMVRKIIAEIVKAGKSPKSSLEDNPRTAMLPAKGLTLVEVEY